MVPTEVDIDFSVIFNWYFSDGENVTPIFPMEHFHSNDSEISQYVYLSVLTMNPASLTLMGSSNITCGSMVAPGYMYHYVVISDEAYDNIGVDLLGEDGNA